jgi:CHAD domain-containing protein
VTNHLSECGARALVERILGERLDAFEEWLAALSEEPGAERENEVRVATRRLLAALLLFCPLLELPDVVDPSILQGLERRLGKLRDLDVLCGRVKAGSTTASGCAA